MLNLNLICYSFSPFSSWWMAAFSERAWWFQLGKGRNAFPKRESRSECAMGTRHVSGVAVSRSVRRRAFEKNAWCEHGLFEGARSLLYHNACAWSFFIVLLITYLLSFIKVCSLFFSCSYCSSTCASSHVLRVRQACRCAPSLPTTTSSMAARGIDTHICTNFYSFARALIYIFNKHFSLTCVTLSYKTNTFLVVRCASCLRFSAVTWCKTHCSARCFAFRPPRAGRNSSRAYSCRVPRSARWCKCFSQRCKTPQWKDIMEGVVDHKK